MIERYDPFKQMLSLRQMMDRLMEDAFVLPSGGQASGSDGAPLNVYEEGDHLVVETHLPGIKPEDVEITVEGDTLTIRGETKAEDERKERNYLVREFRHGSFMRNLRLPDTVNPDRVQTSFENGMLRLSFPRTEQSKRRRISIGSGGQQGQTGTGQGEASQQSAEQRGAEGARSGGSTAKAA